MNLESEEISKELEKSRESKSRELENLIKANPELMWIAHSLARINGRKLTEPDLNYLVQHPDLTIEKWIEQLDSEIDGMQKVHQEWKKFQTETAPESPKFHI